MIDDDNSFEVRAYWVKNYENWGALDFSQWNAVGDPLYYTIYGFAMTLNNAGWNFPTDEGDYSVTLSDFQGSYGIESADAAWFSGHGASNSEENSGMSSLILIDDDPETSLSRVDHDVVSWGGTDLEWVFLHACETLQYDTAGTTPVLKTTGRFANALNGIHLICGAASPLVANLGQIGKAVSEFLTGSNNQALHTVKDSWFLGVDKWQPAKYYNDDIILRVIGEDIAYENDYIWGTLGSGPVPDVTVDEFYVGWYYECTDP